MVFDIELFGFHARTPLFLLSCSSLPKLRLCPVHPCINPIKGHQFLMGSLFGYFPMIQQDDHIRIPVSPPPLPREEKTGPPPHLEQGVIPLAKAIICMTLHHQKKHPEQPKSRHQKVTAKVLFMPVMAITKSPISEVPV